MPSETPQYTLNMREYSSAQKGVNIPWNMRLIWPRPRPPAAYHTQNPGPGTFTLAGLYVALRITTEVINISFDRIY
jgi:hypothetical protein